MFAIISAMVAKSYDLFGFTGLSCTRLEPPVRRAGYESLLGKLSGCEGVALEAGFSAPVRV